MDELLEINRYVGQSLRSLVDMGQSCKWLAVSVGRCGLIAMLGVRFVYRVVVGCLLSVALFVRRCGLVAMGRLLSGRCRSVAMSRCEWVAESCLL